MFKFSKIIIALLFFVHCCLPTKIFAQAKIDTAKNKPTALLRLSPSFGLYKNGSKVLAADLVKSLKTSPVLGLKDEKGTPYQVVSFEFTWRQKTVADDAVSGKPKTVFNMVGQTMKGNKITDDWVEEMTNLIKSGEDINFSSIIYFDAKKGATYLVPLNVAISIL